VIYTLRTPYATARLTEFRASDALSNAAAQAAPIGSTLEDEFGAVLAVRGRVKIADEWYDTWRPSPSWPKGETFVPKELP
jgi:hypothetical protein